MKKKVKRRHSYEHFVAQENSELAKMWIGGVEPSLYWFTRVKMVILVGILFYAHRRSFNLLFMGLGESWDPENRVE